MHGNEFPPYQLKLRSSDGNRKTTYQIDDKGSEERVIQAIQQELEQCGQPLWIERGIFSADLCSSLGRHYTRTRKAFSAHFELIRSPYGGNEALAIKPINQEALDGDWVRVRYPNGRVEERHLKDGVQGRWELRSRTYPNGVIEKGRFEDGNGALFSGYRCSNGEYEFLIPNLFFNMNPFWWEREGINFTELEINGQRQLVLIERAGQIWRRSQKAPIPLLFAAAKEDYVVNTFGELFESPFNQILIGDIVDYAFSIDETTQKPHIFSLKGEGVFEILKQAEALETRLPQEQHQELFAQWVLKGGHELIELMLQIDPTCIDQTSDKEISFFRAALNDWDPKKAEVLKTAMLARNIALSNEDEWVEKISQGDNSFNDDDFTALDPDFQEELYRAAHTHDQVALVERMNGLGMEKPFDPPSGPTPLSINMNLVEQQKAVESYLIELRKSGRLLRADELPAKKAHDQVDIYHDNEKDFSRVLGAEFVKKAVQKLGCKHVDAAETFAVLGGDLDTIHIHTHYGIHLQSKDMQIYADLIKPVKRFISLEEAYELLNVIEEVGFTDIHCNNFIVTADKIYFIDLESTNFQEHADYGLMGNLLAFVDKKDRETLGADMERRFKERQAQHSEDEEETREKSEACRKFYFYGGKRYEFPVASIMDAS